MAIKKTALHLGEELLFTTKTKTTLTNKNN